MPTPTASKSLAPRRSARSVWSALSLLPPSSYHCLTTAPASWTHSKGFAWQFSNRIPRSLRTTSTRGYSLAGPYRARAFSQRPQSSFLRWPRGAVLRRQRRHSPAWQVWLAAMRSARVKARQEGGQTPEKGCDSGLTRGPKRAQGTVVFHCRFPLANPDGQSKTVIVCPYETLTCYISRRPARRYPVWTGPTGNN